MPAPEAAWINGTAAHALDYDDVALRGHPSTVLVPAILAEGESLGATGAQLATAYVAGYEVWADLQRRDPAQHHEKGWHPTGIFGAIAAAAACASLRGLDAEKATQAIALGASQSAGLVANFGTMTKPFHAGRAAHAGVISARLAAAGFTSSPDALEHPLGFLAATSPKGDVDRTSPTQAGRDWNILTLGLSVKKYPLCYCTHRAIDGALDLLREQKVGADNVRSITVSTSRRNATILRNSRPQTGLEAKFSMQFAMASSIVANRVGLRELTDDFVRRKDVQALIPKVYGGARRPRRPQAHRQRPLRPRDDRDHGRPQARKRPRHRRAGLAAAAAVARGAVGQVQGLLRRRQPQARRPGRLRRADVARAPVGRRACALRSTECARRRSETNRRRRIPLPLAGRG